MTNKQTRSEVSGAKMEVHQGREGRVEEGRLTRLEAGGQRNEVMSQLN